MKDFKKRALILMLATTVSVTGAFSSDNYKNCLMNLEFKPVGAHEINVILNTKTLYENKISPIKRDSNTFIIMLPEIDSETFTPDLSEVSGDISSVEIKKMPYANGAKGYTKILIKTSGAVNLSATTARYIPSESPRFIPERISEREDNLREVAEYENNIKNEATEYAAPESETVSRERESYESSSYNDSETYAERNHDSYSDDIEPSENTSPSENTDIKPEDNKPEITTYNDIHSKEMSDQKLMFWLGALFILLTSIYLYIKAKDKLSNVVGEKFNIDLSEEDSKKSKTKNPKYHQNKNVNKSTNFYPQNDPLPMKPFIPESTPEPSEPEEEANIVDLDALFKEKQSQDEAPQLQHEDNQDSLDDFLSGFVFDDTESAETIEPPLDEAGDKLDEDVYARLLNNQNIEFTNEDIECFKELLQSEISEDAIKKMESSLVSNPIEQKEISPDKRLENIIMDYSLKGNITFTVSDIEIIKKLMSVEIDSDFIRDLRTDPKRTAQMAKEIVSEKPNPEPKEITLLDVKGMLPNLEEAVKKQGNKPIKSEFQPQVVYYSEGYEVSKITTDIALPNLAKELNNKNAYISQPSATSPTVDNSYSDSVDKITITDLPDLADVLANPDKYKEPEKEEFVASEDDLLSRIMNVQFKPFDDGSRKFEIINKDINDEYENITDNSIDIERELSGFDNFEVRHEDEVEPVYMDSDYDDFEELYKDNYINLDLKKNPTEETAIEIPDKSNVEEMKTVDEFSGNNEKEPEPFIPKDLERKITPLKRERREKSTELNNILEKIREERKNRKSNATELLARKEPESNTKEPVVQSEPKVKCILEGINYDILSSAEIDSNTGCYLAKSKDRYAVLAYKGETLSIIKEYETVNSNKLHLRLSETLDDNTLRYLIRIGTSKFIIDYRDGLVRYVMDLC